MRRLLARIRLWLRQPLGKPQRIPTAWSTPGHHRAPCQRCGKPYIDHSGADILLCHEMGEPFQILAWSDG